MSGFHDGTDPVQEFGGAPLYPEADHVGADPAIESSLCLSQHGGRSVMPIGGPGQEGVTRISDWVITDPATRGFEVVVLRDGAISGAVSAESIGLVPGRQWTAEGTHLYVVHRHSPRSDGTLAKNLDPVGYAKHHPDDGDGYLAAIICGEFWDDFPHHREGMNVCAECGAPGMTVVEMGSWETLPVCATHYATPGPDHPPTETYARCAIRTQPDLSVNRVETTDGGAS